ncbi:MAG: GAF domain-containing protein [bacterium]|nr:GAF domain-containing protein [bacterium]
MANKISSRSIELSSSFKGILKELSSISQWMGTRVELEDILKRIMDVAIKLSQADQGSLMLLNEETQELSIKVSHGLSQKIANLVNVKKGEPIAGLVAAEGQLLLIKNLQDDPRLTNHPLRKEIKSAISVPLKIQDRVIGVLNLNLIKGSKNKKDAFTEEDIDFICILGTQAAVVIENARLYKTAEERIQELFKLNETSRAIASTLDPEEILNLAFKNLNEIINFDIGSILLFTSDHHLNFIIASDLPLDQALVLNLRQDLAQMLGRLNNHPIKPENILIEPLNKVEVKKGTDCRPIKSQLTVPLICGTNTIGLLNVNSLSGNIFNRDNLRIMTTFASQLSIALENARRHNEMKEFYAATIKALAMEVETRNPYTQRHSERVTQYAAILALKLGLTEQQIEAIKTAGLLHDLGKVGISDNILLKRGKLTSEERAEMETHPVKSGKIVGSLKFFQSILPIIIHHHEHYDGNGYPDQLAGDIIPLEARIIAVADAFDAMTSERPYRGALSMEEARAEVIKHSGTQFDPRVVEVFLKEFPRIKSLKEKNGASG